MNRVLLIGRLQGDPTYHFTEGGMDIVRFALDTETSGACSGIHHCLAYGPAAIDLHTHLVHGTLLSVAGRLAYRSQRGAVRSTVVVEAYSYLDGIAGIRKAVKRPSGVGAVG